MNTLLLRLLALFLIPASFTTYAATQADQAIADGILLLGNGAEPPSLDPHINTAVNGSKIVSTLIEGLIAYHPSDDNLPEPGMAESWSHAGNHQKWTFTLRDAKWTNSEPVTAENFLYSYQRILSPQLGARYAEMLFIIRGAKAFNNGKVTDFSEVGVKAIDSKTLVIELNGPTPYFLNILKHHSWHPVNPTAIEAAGGMTKPDSNWTRDNYVSNGPFRLKEWKMNQVIEVERNPDYWDAKTVKLNGIKFFPIENNNTEDQSFSSGMLHYTATVPPELISVYKERSESSLRIDPYLGTYFFRLNTTVPPLNDKRVRQALSLAINRKVITHRVTKGGQTPAQSFTPPGIAGYTPPTPLAFNIKRARELLAEAGYPGGEGFPPFTLIFNTSESHRAIAEVVQQMWKKGLGIDIELRNQEWKVFLSTMHEMDYQVARSSWIGDYMYPDNFLTMWRTGEGNNETGWSNPQYDQLVTDSLSEANSDKRLEMLNEAEGIFLEEMPIIPIYYYTRTYRIDSRVKGWNPKLLDNRNLKYISF